MKEGIHPAYTEATITCACGNEKKQKVVKQLNLKKNTESNNIFENSVLKSNRIFFIYHNN